MVDPGTQLVLVQVSCNLFFGKHYSGYDKAHFLKPEKQDFK
jgi:hypothetical protein